MSPGIVDAVYQTLTVLLLLSLPFIAAGVVGALLAGALQTATNIKEPVVSYGFRFLTLLLCFYFMSPAIIAHTKKLLMFALN